MCVVPNAVDMAMTKGGWSYADVRRWPWTSFVLAAGLVMALCGCCGQRFHRGSEDLWAFRIRLVMHVRSCGRKKSEEDWAE